MPWTDWAAFVGLVLGTLAAYQIGGRSLPGQWPLLSGWFAGALILGSGMAITGEIGLNPARIAGVIFAAAILTLPFAWLGRRRGARARDARTD